MSTETYGGFIFKCSTPKEAQNLLDDLAEKNTCSASMDNKALSVGIVEICLFSLDDGKVHYAALMRRSSTVVSKRYRLKFFKFYKLQPIPIAEIQQVFHSTPVYDGLFPYDESDISDYVINTQNDTEKRIPPQIWQVIISHLKQLSNYHAQVLDDLERLRRLSYMRFSSAGYEILKQEKEATLLALRLFGEEYEEVLESWVPRDDQVGTYLEGLEGVKTINEDNIILNDLFKSAQKFAPDTTFNDWLMSAHGELTVKRKNSNEQLTIINANRNKIENSTGVDLVYYNHTYRSHVMIQYKMMRIELDSDLLEEENKALKNNKHVFTYRPEGNFDEHVKKMRQMLSLSETSADYEDVKAYRLNNSCFFFKLCESYEFEPVSQKLSQGMYIPLDYMDVLLNSPSVHGPRGGKVITYANVARRFSNTLFTDLMHEGLIGSGPDFSEKIHEEIYRSLLEGRSITIARTSS